MGEPNRRFGVWLLLLCMLCTATVPTAHAAAPFSEDAIMAAYLVRFIGYIEWPNESTKTPITIAVLGANSVAEELSQLLSTPANQQRQIRMQRINSAADIGNAQVLFIGAENSDRLKKLIATVASKPVLVITNDVRGIEAGGVINFIRVDQRIRFEASVVAARKNGLKISSELLAVALRVVLAARDLRTPWTSASKNALLPSLDVRL